MPLPFRTYLINAGKTRRAQPIFFADYLRKCFIGNQMGQYGSGRERGAHALGITNAVTDSSVNRSINMSHLVIALCTSTIQPCFCR